MIKQKGITIKRILIYAFSLSILFHISIFSLFTFTFSLNKESLKPKLNFLGSFLNNQDFMNESSKQSLHKPISHNFKYLENVENKFSKNTDVAKPSNNNFKLADPKQTLKYTFDISEKESDTPIPLEDDIGINLDISPYKPLKFPTQ